MPLTPITALLYDVPYLTALWPTLAPTLPPLLNPDTQSCAKNSQCSHLNLTGLCCPTAEGVFLLCCDGYEQGRGGLGDEWRALVFAALAGELVVYVYVYGYLFGVIGLMGWDVLFLVVDRDTAWTQLLSLPSFGTGRST